MQDTLKECPALNDTLCAPPGLFSQVRTHETGKVTPVRGSCDSPLFLELEFNMYLWLTWGKVLMMVMEFTNIC